MFFNKKLIDKLIKRLDNEIKLGYYDDSTLRKVRKWAIKLRKEG